MNTDGRLKNSVRNIMIGTIGSIITPFISFAGRTVFIRTLTADYLGLNGLFSNVLNMLSLAEMGVGSAIIYALYKPLAEQNERVISALMNFYAKAYRIIGCTISVMGLMLMPLLPYIIGETPEIQENIYVIYILYLLNTSSSYFFSYKLTLLTADQKHYLVTGLSSAISWITTFAQIFILIFTHQYMLYLVIQISSTFIYNIILSFVADKKYSFVKKYKEEHVDKSTKRGLMKNVKALMIIKISGMLVTSTDNIIITIFNGLSITGVTSNYTLLSGTVSGFLTQVSNGISASVGNYNATNSDTDNYKMFERINFLNFWAYGWCSICLILLSNPFIHLIWGGEYVSAVRIPIAIGINLYVLGMQSTTWMFKSTLGLFNYGKYILLGTATINLVLSCALGNIFGVFGILIATSIARLCTNAWYEPYAVFKYGLHQKPIKYFKRYILYFTVTAGALVITASVCLIVQSDGICGFLLRLLICCIVPNVFFGVFFYRTDEFKYLWSLILRIFSKAKHKKYNSDGKHSSK